MPQPVQRRRLLAFCKPETGICVKETSSLVWRLTSDIPRPSSFYNKLNDDNDQRYKEEQYAQPVDAVHVFYKPCIGSVGVGFAQV